MKYTKYNIIVIMIIIIGPEIQIVGSVDLPLFTYLCLRSEECVDLIMK